MPSGDTRASEVIARVGLAAALVAAVLALSAYPFDDAFIHLRLARNLAFHGEPYFNLGERVMSGSSPLWMLWLAGAFRLSGQASIGLAIASECLVIVALFVVAEGFLAHGRRRSWLTFIAAFIVTALALPGAGGLMETPLAVTLLAGGLWAFRSGRFSLAGLLLGFASTTRFEMVLPALGAVIVAPDWKARFKVTAGGAPVAIAGVALLAVFYGTLLPQGMAAKALVYRLTLRDVLTSGPQELGKWTGAILILVLGGATIAALIRIFREKSASFDWSRHALVLMGALPVTLIVIYGYQVALVFPWYWTMSLCPMALVAWSRLQDESRRSSWKNMSIETALAVTATATLACASVIGVGAAATGRLELSPWLLENARTRTYLNIGTALADRCSGSVVAAPEIGALGWAFDGRILDGDGLASPEVLRFHPLLVPEERPNGGLGLIPGRAIAAFRPDLIVSMEVFSTDFTARAAFMPELSDYALWWREPVLAADVPGQPVNLWNSAWTLVFSRHRTPQGPGCSG